MQKILANSDDCGVIIHIRGRVQGVGFRFFTYQQAQKCQLVGYVKNLADGRVEIVACGLNHNITMLIDWLNSGGPRSAKIEDYTVNHFVPKEYYSTFNVRY